MTGVIIDGGSLVVVTDEHIGRGGSRVVAPDEQVQDGAHRVPPPRGAAPMILGEDRISARLDRN